MLELALTIAEVTISETFLNRKRKVSIIDVKVSQRIPLISEAQVTGKERKEKEESKGKKIEID